jgi:hypothetical protein
MGLSSIKYTKELKNEIIKSYYNQPDWAYQRDLALIDEIDRLNDLLYPKCSCNKCTGIKSIESYYEDSENQ